MDGIIFLLTAKVVKQRIVGYVRGGVPKRSTGADCKSAGLAFVGSNPTPSTISDNYYKVEKRLRGKKFTMRKYAGN